MKRRDDFALALTWVVCGFVTFAVGAWFHHLVMMIPGAICLIGNALWLGSL